MPICLTVHEADKLFMKLTPSARQMWRTAENMRSAINGNNYNLHPAMGAEMRKTERLTLRIRPTTKVALATEAQQLGLSQSDFVAYLLAMYQESVQNHR